MAELYLYFISNSQQSYVDHHSAFAGSGLPTHNHIVAATIVLFVYQGVPVSLFVHLPLPELVPPLLPKNISCHLLCISSKESTFAKVQTRKNTHNMVSGLSIGAVIIAVVIIAVVMITGACCITTCLGQA